jgi:hypothetical protein
MTDIDDRIRKSLSSEDQAFLEQLDAGGSLYRDIAATFQGRLRWLNTLGWIVGFVLFAVAVFCGWRFVTQPDLRSMQLWGAGAALAVCGIGLIKLWYWGELQANSIVRELKRVELQVASLASAVRGSQSK